MLGGWWLKAIWEALRDLQSADRDLTDKLARVEILVAGNYVTRDEMARSMSLLMSALNRIEDKLSGKADKP